MVATTVTQFVTRAPPLVGEAEEREESAASPDRCQFWLPNKRRLCANTPLPSSRFCGNHDPDAGARRIPCPIDPSHSVSEDNLQSHVKKCPFRKQALALESQPYYSKGINGSPDDDYVDSAAKRNAILQLSVKDFQTLLEKVKSIHSTISVVLLDSYVIPDACSAWLKQQHLDRKLPYQEKHAMQQASIVGNIEATGILQKPNESTEPFYQEIVGRDHFGRDESQIPAVVEFGAGRGYLTQMLTDCYGLGKVCLIERKSYKLKADRSLRQSQNIILERLRIDIEDLNLKEVNLLKGLQYIAIGKHLCGPATDLTISCCLSGQGEQNKETHSTIPNLQGLALATCCHHLCQWKHYANTKFLLSLGITKEEFHAMTWFTSWAVDADHSSELADMPFNATNISTIKEKQADLLGGSVDDAIRSIPTLDRARLGFMCKEIIDTGRLFWLREHGMEAQLVKYVPLSISPENHLLIAK
ncbi:tRNA:m(4)X modification enzyme TRM13-like isoform X1 [Zingiber officinale]|uniref:tRNA:m(4)X modification enzyme TRM13-like isoform X1 n=1 Tax=Zingiber officinale TaxID=94328 RepID=UPI001C4CBAD8|nr:tRNA:m(4)X modification enzyme TRM13-like isoform X1 [Zingiber officinale]